MNKKDVIEVINIILTFVGPIIAAAIPVYFASKQKASEDVREDRIPEMNVVSLRDILKIKHSHFIII